MSAHLAAATMPRCTWQAGRQRYTGTRAAAVARLAGVLNLQPWQAQWLATSMRQRPEGDDQVHITRAAIAGTRHSYHPTITHMHFDAGSLCLRVDRSAWRDTDHEAGLVWLVPGTQQGLMLPAVCGNWCIVQLRTSAAGDRSGHGGVLASGRPMDAAPQDASPVGADAPPAEQPSPGGNAQGPGLRIDPAPHNSWARAAEPTPADPGPVFDTGPAPASPDGGPAFGGSPWPAMPTWPTAPHPPGLVQLPAPVPPIPEPRTISMALAGLGAVLWLARRRQALARKHQPTA